MKGYNRLEQIMDYLKGHNLVTVDQLVAVTDASPATIRRDLIKLDQEGVISRTHGGVTLNRFIPSQPTTSEKMQRSLAEKHAIACAAAAFVKAGDAVVLDGIRFEVLRADERSLESLLAERVPVPQAAEGDDESG